MNIQEKILKILKNGKDNILYQINDDKLTYQKCYERVINLSKNLNKQGSSPIIVYGHKSIDTFVSILACLIAKRSYIPVDLYTPINRIKKIIKSSQATLLIKNEDIAITDIEALTISEINKKYCKITNTYENSNEYAYIIYTSGSTGNPKGVPITYQNLSHFAEWIISVQEHQNCLKLNILSQASFSFDLSLMDIYFSIFTYSHIVALDSGNQDDINRIIDIIKRNDINYLIMTPTFIKLLLINNDFNENNLPQIKWLFFCGECLEVETVKKIKERFSQVKIINAYGPTEATCCVSLIEIDDKMTEKNILPVGKVDKSATDIEILNNEIVLKGSSVFKGYLGLDSDNIYLENNTYCYKTGDIGYIQDNYLYCSGRIDNQIKYQGYRIELSDIENNLLKIDGITGAVVIAKYKENTNIVKMIKAFVAGTNLEEELIKKELKKLLPQYMIPKRIVIMDSLPVNENGKYDRKKLNNL